MEFINNIINTQTFDAIKTSLVLAFFSTLISGILGISLGILIEENDFRGKGILLRIIRTLMALPPVVAGLLVYLIFMRRGIFGSLRWLFTIKAMIVAQVLIITPLITGMTYSYAKDLGPSLREFAISMGASKRDKRKLMIFELKDQLVFVLITGFSRSISEVGAVMLVGGNIKGRTRTMTTTISLLKSQGIYSEGVFLGIILLIITFILQLIIERLNLGGPSDN